jgi:O-antigen/teichoic acid export membrane protein
VIGAALAWSSARWRPAAAFDVAEFRRMFAFGLSVVGSDGVALLRQWAETAVIGAVLGVTGLGYLNVAQRLVAVASDLSASAIVPVSTVVFARIRATADELRRTYLRALSTSYAVVMPFLVFVTVGAGDIMRILFGAGWGPSVVPAQALSIAGILTLGAALDSGLFYGTGRPGRWFAYATAVDAATVAATAIGVRWGLVGTSLGFVAVALAATIARWFLVGRHLGASAARVARPILSTAVAGAASGGAGLLVGAALAGASAWPRLCAVGCVVVLVHLAVLRVSAPATFLDVRRMLGGRADRVRSRLRTARRTVSDAIPDPRDGAVPTRR